MILALSHVDFPHFGLANDKQVKNDILLQAHTSVHKRDCRIGIFEIFFAGSFMLHEIILLMF